MAVRRKITYELSSQFFASIFLIFLFVAPLCLLCGCSKDGDEQAQAFAMDFTLKDWLCTITPRECHRPVLEKLFTAPPDAMYKATRWGTKLQIPMGYIDPVTVVFPVADKLYFNAFGQDMAPRGKENISEFIRNGPHPGLIEFNVSKGDPSRSFTPQMAVIQARTEEEHHIQFSEAAKRYPDIYGLKHWGNDYERARWAKPCERAGEMEQCGMVNQEDMYIPLKANGFQSYMKCGSWLALKASSAEKELAMTQKQRDIYFESGQYAREREASPWRMSIDPHCRHHMHYARLPGAVVLTYHLALLPHWKQIEDRTRAILDAALDGQSLPQ
jgi:hypothetical protein